jgi:mRNA interferase RelE/StbE
MNPFTIEFVKSARKEFEGLPFKVRSRIVEALQLLAQNPYSELLKVKKLKDAHDLFRIRIGDYRVLYELQNEQLVVLVIKVGHRREVYRK